VILTGGVVSVALIMALVLAIAHAALLTFVTVVAVRTDDKNRRKTAVEVLEILVLRRRQLPRSKARRVRQPAG
jgi:ABC-type phosphate transport system auxiliary subunit